MQCSGVVFGHGETHPLPETKMATAQLNKQFELQYKHGDTWLDRHSGATDYFQAFSPDDLLFDTYESAVHALHEMEIIGMNRDDLRIVGIDLTDAS